MSHDSDDTRSESPNHAGWATFEARVRGRRFGRCIERASLAMDLGKLDDARAAVSEAKTLSPDAPEIADFENRLRSLSSPNAVLLAHNQPSVDSDPASVDSDPGWLTVTAGMAVLIVLFSALGFGLMQLHFRSIDQLLSVASFSGAADADITEEKRPNASVREATTSPEPEKPIEVETPTGNVETPTGNGKPPAVTATTGSVRTTRRPAATSGAAGDRPWRLTENGEQKRSAVEAPSRPLFRPPPAPAPERTAAPHGSLPPIERARVVAEPSTTSPPSPAAVPALAREESAVVSIPTSAMERPAESAHAESDRIRSVLVRYENAYNRLDAKAAAAVWPRVDQAALGRAFDGLITQRVSLGLCEITVIGNVGGASCAGKARWEPKIGAGLQTADRYWSFNLRKTDDGWRIEELRVR